MAYNLDAFERLVRPVPPAGPLRRATVAGGVGYALGLAALRWLTGGSGVLPGAVLALAGLLVPALAVAALTHRLAPGFDPDDHRDFANWAYLTALGAATLLASAAAVAVLCSSAAAPSRLPGGPAVFGFGVAATFLTTFAVLVLTAGTDRFAVDGLLAAVQPAAAAAVAHGTAGRFGVGPDGAFGAVPPVAETAAAAAVVGGGLVLSVRIHEALFDANVPYIDGARLTSALLQHRPEDIDAGFAAEPPVHTLRVEAGDRTGVFVGPHVHPGPITRFGGGNATVEVIDHVLESYDGGFFLKGPATHESDPANTDAPERVCDAISDPETHGTATPLVHGRYGEFEFHGRRFGDDRVVYVEPDAHDDFDRSALGTVVGEETLVVDRHAYEPPDGDGKGAIERHESTDAAALRSHLERFLADLEDAETAPYRAGWAVDTGATTPEGGDRAATPQGDDRAETDDERAGTAHHDERAVCALVEEVGDQTTLFLGVNENEATDSLAAYVAELERDGRFDEVVSATTDTHHSLLELARDRPVDHDRLDDVVERATEACAPAAVGHGVERADGVRLLGAEYYSLILSVNLVLRSFTLSLAVLYAAGAVPFLLG